jgi:transcriptional regulator with XRE-family HTH domain
MSIKKPHMALGNRLKIIRKELKFSQSEMAKRLKIATSTYQYYERGERDAYASTLINLTAYGVNSDWLLTGSGDPFTVDGSAINNNDLADIKPSHPSIITKFKQKDLAWEINWSMLKLESEDPEELKEIHDFINYRISKIEKKKGQPESEESTPKKKKA